MRYWWVNQNQTYRHEIGGGYLWSPKRKANEQRNPFYESMREVAPGDVIFSFFDTRISALGIAKCKLTKRELIATDGVLSSAPTTQRGVPHERCFGWSNAHSGGSNQRVTHRLCTS